MKNFLIKSLNKSFPVPVDTRGMITDVNPAQMNAVDPRKPGPVQFGIEAITVDLLMAESLGLKGSGGVLVNKVFVNSPAYFAGIKRGDVVTAMGGVPVTGSSDVAGIVSHLKSGDNVNVRVMRDGRESELLVMLR